MPSRDLSIMGIHTFNEPVEQKSSLASIPFSSERQWLLLTEIDQPSCSSIKVVSLPLEFSFTHFYLRRALHLNICFKLFATLINLNLAIHPFHHLQISIILFSLSSLVCLFCLPASITLQSTSSDDNLTLLSNDSEYKSSITSIDLIFLSTYTTSLATLATRFVKNVLLNKDHYAKQILKDYNLKHIRLLFQFNIFSNSSLS